MYKKKMYKKMYKKKCIKKKCIKKCVKKKCIKLQWRPKKGEIGPRGPTVAKERKFPILFIRSLHLFLDTLLPLFPSQEISLNN